MATTAKDRPQPVNPTPRPTGSVTPAAAGSSQLNTVLGDDSNTVVDASGAPAAPEEIIASHPAPAVPGHELLRCIGRGSYGEVWLARNVMGTFRAVKVVYRDSFEHARPFEREFNGIKKFEPISRSHEGLVDVLHVGRAEDSFHYVMEVADDVVAGQEIDPASYTPKTLRGEVTERGRLPFERCLEVALTLTQGLGHLHKHGLIHRDIKPSNIIFVHGTAKLADIGLVAEQSEAKSFVGTEGFIPPEGPGTPQADIYSLGKVLYEIATGKDRHDFPALPTLLGDRETETHLLELNTVFLKACQGDLKQRYQTCAQMREDLLLLQSGKSVKKAQATERRLAHALRIGAAGVVLIAVVLAALFYLRLEERRARARAELETALRTDAQRHALEARRNLYAADMLLAFQAADAGNFGRTRELLDRNVPKAGEVDLRGWEWRYLWRTTRSAELGSLHGHSKEVESVAFCLAGTILASASLDRTVRLWDPEKRAELGQLPHSTGVRSLAPSPDGAWLATGARDGVIRVWDVAGRQVLFTLTNGGAPARLMFSPDARLLAAASQWNIRLWEVASKREIESFRITGGNVTPVGVAFSPDSNVFAFGRREGEVDLWDIAGRRLAATFTAHRSSVSTLAFKADGSQLVSAGWDNVIKVWGLPDRRLIAQLTNHLSRVTEVAFSPDGRTLASASADQRLRLWDTTRWIELASFPGHTKTIYALAYSPNGALLATAGKDETVKLWPTQPPVRRTEQVALPTMFDSSVARDGSRILMVETNGAATLYRPPDLDHPTRHVVPDLNLAGLDVGPDGTSIITLHEGGLFRLWDPEIRRERGQFPRPPGEHLGGYAWLSRSPDGTRIAVSPRNDRVSILEVSSGRGIATLTNELRRFFCFGWSPDGRSAATGNDEGEVVLWSVEKQREVRRFLGHKQTVADVALSANNELLASVSWDGTAKVWATATGEPLASLTGSLMSLHSVTISPDGKRLAAGSAEGLVKLWDLETLQEVATLADLSGSGAIFAVSFLPDGQSLLAVNRSIRVWQAAR
jgi:WD40 repeat protein